MSGKTIVSGDATSCFFIESFSDKFKIVLPDSSVEADDTYWVRNNHQERGKAIIQIAELDPDNVLAQK